MTLAKADYAVRTKSAEPMSKRKVAEFSIKRSGSFEWLGMPFAPDVASQPSDFVDACEVTASRLQPSDQCHKWVDLAKANDFVLVRNALEAEWLSAPGRDLAADQLLGVLSALLGGSHVPVEFLTACAELSFGILRFEPYVMY